MIECPHDPEGSLVVGAVEQPVDPEGAEIGISIIPDPSHHGGVHVGRHVGIDLEALCARVEGEGCDHRRRIGASRHASSAGPVDGTACTPRTAGPGLSGAGDGEGIELEDHALGAALLTRSPHESDAADITEVLEARDVPSERYPIASQLGNADGGGRVPSEGVPGGDEQGVAARRTLQNSDAHRQLAGSGPVLARAEGVPSKDRLVGFTGECPAELQCPVVGITCVADPLHRGALDRVALEGGGVRRLRIVVEAVDDGRHG